jgi:hypothetical protein
MSDRKGNGTQQFEATMPTCPPWCVDCWDLSDDLPGSRFHHGEPTPPIPARVQIGGVDNDIRVRTSFCDVLPELRRPGLSDDTARVDLCLGERDVTASLAADDARRLAQAILQQVETIERSPSTRQ